VGRRQLYSSDQIFDATRDAVAQYGRDATLAQVCEQISMPSGSVYHRFGSREELMMRLWLRSIQRFHARLLAVVAGSENAEEALVTMAAETVRYCRTNPAEALAMTLYSHERLMAAVPETLHDEAEHVNDEAFALVARLAAERFPHLSGDPRLFPLTFTAVLGLCYGLVRPYVIGQHPIPQWLDDVAEQACRAALTVGDTWRP
jgi:AcrR family transcriptional regulator